MNFIFISPQFPKTYWNFCDRLKKNGVNAMGNQMYTAKVADLAQTKEFIRFVQEQRS